jgi:hypothetical protein
MILKPERFPIFILYTTIVLAFCACNQQRFLTNGVYDDCIEKATKCNENQQFDSAFVYYHKAKQACDDNETEKKNYCLVNIAAIEQQKSDFSGSEVTAIEALENNSQSIYLPNIYNQLGIAYAEQNDFENAITNYNKAYAVTPDSLSKIIIKNNMAVIYLEEQKYLDATKTLLPLLKSPVLVKNPLEYAKIIDNLGFAYFKSNDSKALFFLNKALQIRENQKINYELIASYLHLAAFYEYKDPKKAINFAKLEYSSAAASNSIDDKIEALKFLVKNSVGTTSKEYALEQIRLSDSIFRERQKSKTQFAKIKYDSKKAIQDSAMQKKQKEVFIALFIFTFTIGAFIFFLARSKHKRKVLQTSYNTEIEIAKNLHDELANNMFHTMTFAETQNLDDAEKKESLLEDLDKIYSKIRDFSKRNSPVDTGENFLKALIAMISDFGSKTVTVSYKNDFDDWIKIKPEKKIVLYRALLELMVNMKKHSQCTFVFLKFQAVGKMVVIDYFDNGVGDKDNLFLNKGLKSTENRIKTINGTVIFDAETKKGFKLKISFPK